MEEHFKEASEDLETSLSSVPISFPSGQKFDNISTITEVSDSEMEHKKVEIDQERFSQGSDDDDDVLTKVNDCDILCSKDEIQLDDAHHLSFQVRDTLKANASMLIDKNILNHLLQPENANYANYLLNVQKKFNLAAPQYNEDILEDVQDSNNVYNKYSTINDIKGVSAAPYLNVNSTPKKSSASNSYPQSKPLNSATSGQQKHVNFAPESILNENDTSKSLPVQSYFKKPVHNMHSFTSYGPEIVFDKLSEIRSHLDIKEGGEDASVSDLPFSRLLVAKLNSQKQRTKDLEEELTLNEASLTKITCELEIVQKRLLRREEQLKDAGDQIGKLQNEWQVIQQRLMISRDTYRNQNEQLKRMLETLRAEKEAAERELKFLREDHKEFSSLKVTAEGMKYQVEKSSKQSEEVLQENQRLLKQLKEKEDKLQHLEKSYIPQLEGETKRFTHENEKLHSKLDHLSLSKGDADEELKMLKKRHSVLLEKAVEDAELKEKALHEKQSTMELVEKVKMEKSALMEELHDQYQNQLQTILLKKITELGMHFDAKERKQQEEFNKQVMDLKKSFENEKESLRTRNLEEQEALRKKLDLEKQAKEEELRDVRTDYQHLRTQMETIVSAISAVMPKARSEVPGQKGIQHSDLLYKLTCPPPLRSSEMVNKYHLTHVGGLEPCQIMGLNGVPPSGKENAPKPQKVVTSANLPQFSGLPLITSTSLSSISDGSGQPHSSVGRVGVREKKQSHKAKNKIRTSPHQATQRTNSRVKKFNGRKLLTAAQIVGSSESLVSSDKSSKENFLKEVDKEMSDLVQEINSMSEIVAPHCANETPRHDTSLEQDSAHLALQRIDRVSDILSKYVAGT